MITIGALEEVSAHELKMWSGPIHYLPIQGVFKPTSVTTPLRLVTNSSLVDPETGLSLNSILAKGPMYLNDMWEILVRFRSYEAGLIGLLPNPDRASRVPLQKGSVEVWGGGRTLEDICL